MLSFAGAYVLLLLSFGTTLLLCRLTRIIPRPRWSRTRRLVATGTSYNRNWFLAHVVPLSKCGVDEIIFVADSPQAALERVRFVCPPRWASRILGRALSKLLWMLFVGLRHSPDLYMGYHVFPGGLTALIVGRLLRRPACYQMTGGPIEVLGGGADSENVLMSKLARPSSFLERMAVAVVREFDLVVVRGSKARRFLADRNLNGTLVTIPGSVGERFFEIEAQRCYDLVFVGRLTEIKQPQQFIEIVEGVRRRIPTIRAVMVGGGPLNDMVREQADRCGVAERIVFIGKSEDSGPVLAKSRVFVLTSRSEGLSIAMAEAMAAGVVPVVADVGDLADLVHDGRNGYVVEPGNIQAFVARIVELLRDERKLARFSQMARRAALRHQPDKIARRWETVLMAGHADGSYDGAATVE